MTIKKSVPRTLIIVRHAHRNKTFGSDADNGLSAKGKKQAKALSKLFKKRFAKQSPILFSSPKKRCVETITPLAKRFARQKKAEITILDTLNEAVTHQELQKKITDFHLYWRSLDAPLAVACSHGDWIPAYMQMVTGARIDLDKGGWIELEETRDGALTLRWMIQDPSI